MPAWHHVVIYCNVDYVLFYNVIQYINSLLSCIHVNTADLLNIMCTLVVTCGILWRLECNKLSCVKHFPCGKSIHDTLIASHVPTNNYVTCDTLIQT